LEAALTLTLSQRERGPGPHPGPLLVYRERGKKGKEMWDHRMNLLNGFLSLTIE
jgi:hypothetical protein